MAHPELGTPPLHHPRSDGSPTPAIADGELAREAHATVGEYQHRLDAVGLLAKPDVLMV